MAYSETLADRIHALLADRVDVTQRKMFGGLAFMVGGHMACGVVGDELMLRLGEEGAYAALDEQHVRPMTSPADRCGRWCSLSRQESRGKPT